MKEKGILESIAKVFADQDKADKGVDMGVMLTMYELGKKIGLHESALMTINLNLTAALKDCANGKKIALEKRKD